ncbi:hypothetical protein QTJ16_002091 [Diplocarpon rosae]|uniref:HNH domain-containing protein n=1 Tax=Diplocarpon rosae TaxID=946125 RepID=A0AAD9T2R6_9HELO|nr:hypothetical protein QTJ16_002091 [Diplocarpon rosae]
MDRSEDSNFQLFRDCLSTPLIAISNNTPTRKARKARGGRKNAIKPVIQTEEPNDAEELGDFIDALYTDPLSTSTRTNILDALPPTITDTLTTYSFLPSQKTTSEFLSPILDTYISALLTAPPAPSITRTQATECEICERSWIPLTYHHLIPKAVHAKVLRRGLHTEDQLENVAWLCRACHSYVHRVAGGEELAKDFFTVERLLQREDVQRFAEWVGKVRWKAK